jgi:hypothetical protein
MESKQNTITSAGNGSAVPALKARLSLNVRKERKKAALPNSNRRRRFCPWSDLS